MLVKKVLKKLILKLMKNNIIIILLFLNSNVIFGQEQESLNLLETDSTWTKEIIKFPLGFAKEIKFEGFEDLRFPSGWSKQESPNFWSYVWAWSIKDIEGLTEHELENNIQLYFDGLMGINFRKNTEDEIQNTNAIFIKKATSNGNYQYIGKVKTFDMRYTKKPMTLNVLVEQHYCEQKKRSIILFRFSPKSFDTAVWNTLQEVKLRENICD
jgi:hypothetical protein